MPRGSERRLEANLTTKSRCKMQNSEEKEEEEKESPFLPPSLPLFLERIPRCVARKVEVEYFCSECYLPLFLFSLSQRRRYVPPLRLCRSSYRRCSPCSSLLSATTSFDSFFFFLSASTRECVKQNETRVPAPCRLTRLDPSFRPRACFVHERERERKKRCFDRDREESKRIRFSEIYDLWIARKKTASIPFPREIFDIGSCSAHALTSLASREEEWGDSRIYFERELDNRVALVCDSNSSNFFRSRDLGISESQAKVGNRSIHG